MSSSILPEGGTDQIRPFAWRTVALTGETQDRRRAAETKNDGGAGRSHPLETRIAELEKTMEARTRAAREEGIREGEARSKAQAQETVASVIERLAQSIAGLDEYRTRLHRQTETEAVRLSIAIARRVLRRELTVDPGAIEGLVLAALERLQSQESCRVRMHPDHVPALRTVLDRLGMTGKVEVVPDPAEELGAALFEMPRGNLDASIDSQLREIERGLTDRFQRPR